MLENCRELFDCEKILSEKLKQVDYIRKVKLTQDDFSILDQMVKDKIIKDQDGGLAFLKGITPIALSYLLVLHGSQYYIEGAYWESVLQKLRLDDTMKYRLILSHTFLRVLKNNSHLAAPNITGAHRYVTPILLHGGIPLVCLPQFFDEVVDKYVQNNITDEELIRSEVRELRKNFQRYEARVNDQAVCEVQIKKIETRIHSLQWAIRWQKAFERIAQIGELPNEWRHVKDCTEFMLRGEQTLNKLRETADQIRIFREEYVDISEQLRTLSALAERHQELSDRIVDINNKLVEITKAIFPPEIREACLPIVIRVEIPTLKGLLEKVSCLNEEILRLERAGAIIRKNRVWDRFFYSLMSVFRWKNLKQKRVILQQNNRAINERRLEMMDVQNQIEITLNRLPLSGMENTSEFINGLVDIKSHVSIRELLLSKLQNEERDAADWWGGLKDSSLTRYQGWQDEIVRTGLDQQMQRAPLVSEHIIQVTKAVTNFITQISEELSGVEETQRLVQQEIDTVKGILLEYGAGDIEQGKVLWLKKEKASRRKNRCKARCARNIFRLSICNMDAIALSRELSGCQARLKELNTELEVARKETSVYSPPYPYVDEPVQRFMLYGRDWAEDWLCAAIRMSQSALEVETASLQYPTVPYLVLESFANMASRYHRLQIPDVDDDGTWSEDIFNSCDVDWPVDAESEKLGLEELLQPQFRKPSLRFDSGTGVIRLILPSQHISLSDIADNNITLTIYNKAIKSKRISLTLKAYKCRNDIVETSSIEKDLDYLAANFLVILHSGSTVIKSWKIFLWSGHQPCLAFTEKGQHRKLDCIGPERIWIVLSSEYRLITKECALIERTIGDIILYLVDFGRTGKIIFAQETKKTFSVSGITDRQDQPSLLGESIEHALADGLSIYPELPLVRLPCLPGKPVEWEIAIKDLNNELAQIHLSHIRNKDVTIGKDKSAVFDLADIPFFDLFAAGPVGVALKQQEYVYRLDFVYIPDFSIDIKPSITMPSEVPEKYLLQINSPKWALLKNFANNIISTQSNTERVLTVNGKNNQTSFCLRDSRGKGADSNVIVNLPKISWKLEEAGPYYTAEELWWEDWKEKACLQLVVEIPNRAADRIRLKVSNASPVREVPVNHGLACFDLKSFADEINKVEILSLIVEVIDRQRKSIIKGTLFNVRNKWKVSDIQCKTVPYGEGVRLDISWNEQGKAVDRRIRLWHLRQPWKVSIEHVIPNGEFQTKILLSKAEELAGPYLGEFFADDQWGVEELHFPEKAFNTFVVNSNGQRKFDKISIEWRGTNSAIVRGRLFHCPSETKVKLVMLGVSKTQCRNCISITQTDKYGWFEGILDGSEEVPLKSWAHWIAICDNEFSNESHLQIMPEPAPLELPLNRSYLEALNGQYEGAQIKVVTELWSLENPVLSARQSSDMLNQWQRGNRAAGISLKIGEDRQDMQLFWEDDGQAIVDISYYVCSSCNKIVQTQALWHQFHSPKCKSINTHKEHQLKAQLLLIWDMKKALEKFKRDYPLAEPNLLQISGDFWGQFQAESASLEKITTQLSLEEMSMASVMGRKQ